MIQKERIVIYPFDMDFLAALRYAELLKEYEISDVVSLNGWGLAEKDAGIVGKSKSLGIKINCDFKKKLPECDAVLFINTHIKPDFEKAIYPRMLEAISYKKNILCEIEVTDDIKEKLTEIAVRNSVNCSFLNQNKMTWPSISENEIYDIKTPVVFILGISERTNKFEIQLALRKRLMNEGYKICQVGTKRYCELFGFHSIPGFMFDRSMPEADKITLLNHYIKALEKTEKPDIIIIGIPGGTMKINSKFTNHYGITAYEISQAITPDAVICSVLYEDYKAEFFEFVSRSLQYKLGFKVDCFNISNYKFDWAKSDTTNKITYTLLDSKVVNEKKEGFSGLETPIYNILDDDDTDKMYQLIIDKLSRYAEVSAF